MPGLRLLGDGLLLLLAAWLREGKEAVVVDVEEVLLGHAEAESGQVFGAGIYLTQLEQLHVVALTLGEVHLLRQGKDEAQALGGGGDMGHEQAVRKALLPDLLPQATGVGHMIHVNHHQVRGVGAVVLALALVEPGVPAEGGQLTLEARTLIVGGGLLYLLAEVAYAGVLHDAVEKLAVHHLRLAGHAGYKAEFKVHRAPPFCRG